MAIQIKTLVGCGLGGSSYGNMEYMIDDAEVRVSLNAQELQEVQALALKFLLARHNDIQQAVKTVDTGLLAAPVVEEDYEPF